MKKFEPDFAGLDDVAVLEQGFVYRYSQGALVAVGALSQGPRGYWSAVMRTDAVPGELRGAVEEG